MSVGMSCLWQYSACISVVTVRTPHSYCKTPPAFLGANVKTRSRESGVVLRLNPVNDGSKVGRRALRLGLQSHYVQNYDKSSPHLPMSAPTASLGPLYSPRLAALHRDSFYSSVCTSTSTLCCISRHSISVVPRPSFSR